MGFRYLKSTVKINKILEVKNIINSLAFLKTFIKCLKLNFNIIYLDELAKMIIIIIILGDFLMKIYSLKSIQKKD